VKKRFIDPVIIRTLVEEGASDSEIACRMGWTVGTLRVRCSQLNISLRRRVKKNRSVKATGRIKLPLCVLDLLVERASAMGLSAPSLAAELLTTIAKDDLYNAVLDSEDHRAPALCPVQPLEVDLVADAA
jgi:hypothetical protein